jgi:putative multiple sugar transport system ATP-binding protein
MAVRAARSTRSAGERRRQVDPDEGAVRACYPAGTYDGRSTSTASWCEFHNIRDSEHAGIVIIHQEARAHPGDVDRENIFLGNETAKSGVINWLSTRVKARELLARVGLEEEPDTKIRDIGVGKQQLVEIAKALSKDVKLLILDEPTAALNAGDSQHLLDLIAGLRSKGVTCIMISHKLNEIEQIADSITIIRDGKSIETLRVKEDGVDENRIIRGMVGRDIESGSPTHVPRSARSSSRSRTGPSGTPTSGPLVCKSESFFVRRGEIVGFAGLMGAGRTELMRSIFGQLLRHLRQRHALKDGQELSSVGARGDRRGPGLRHARTARPSASTSSTTSSGPPSRPS